MRRHLLLWITVIAFLMLLSPLVSGLGSFRGRIDAEAAGAAEWYGTSQAIAILRNTNTLYDIFMKTPGIDGFIHRHFEGDMASDLKMGIKLKGNVGRFADNTVDYWSSLISIVYLFLMRLATAWMWVCYLSPFLLVIAFDGIMTRKAKRASFRYTSPTIYNMSWHLAIFVVFSSVFLFALPIPLNIFYYPGAITLVGILVRMVIGNIQYSA